MNKKLVALNIMSSLLLQIVTLISGFIIPKVILTCFGSEVNGLISSITQFLNYITLLEGGVSGVIMASLYKPIEEGNEQKISGIVKAANQFFYTIGKIYIVYTLIISVAYYFFIDTRFSFGYVMAMVLILGINLLIQYFFSYTLKVLLNASRKVYIVSLTQIIIIVINVILVVVLAKVYPQIHVIKLGSAVIFLLQPLIYTHFLKKYYHLDKNAEADNEAISQRWDGFGQNLAFFIHTNTDVVILTIFTDLIEVSVYSVYNLVAKGLKSLVTSISSAIVPSIGQVLARGNEKEIKSSVDMYEFGIGFISTLFFTCGIILIVPFVKIYTWDITDGNYIRPAFGLLILLAEYIYCFRDPYVSISYASGHFKQTAKYAYMEAAVNILLSLILIRKVGIIGVAIGTLISMILRMICSVIYLKHHILHRPIRIFIKKAVVFWLSAAAVASFFLNCVHINPKNYMEWCILGLEAGVVTGIVLCIVSFLFFRKEFCKLFGRFKKGNRR